MREEGGSGNEVREEVGSEVREGGVGVVVK